MRDKTEFLTHFRRKPVKVVVGGRELWLLPLSRLDLSEITAEEQPDRRVALAAVRSVCDPDGKRIFDDKDVDEYRGWLSMEDQDAIYGEIATLNRLRRDEGKAPSTPTPNSSSASGSPAT
jgi:hypothetical protein